MKYTTLLFDSDDTLLDFARSEKEALKIVMCENGLPFSDEIHACYSRANKSFWEAYERGEIEKSEIYVGRFRKFLSDSGIDADPAFIARNYEANLAKQFFMIDGAADLIKKLKEKYRIYIVTNGNEQIQKSRLNGSGLINLVDGVFVSEAVGVPKPEKRYFDYVFANIPEKDKSKILIIGDSQSSDILGGINAGIDTCWYNPFGKTGKYTPTYEVKSLNEIEKMLDL